MPNPYGTNPYGTDDKQNPGMLDHYFPNRGEYKTSAQWAGATFLLLCVSFILLDQAWNFIKAIDWHDYLDPLGAGEEKNKSLGSRGVLTLFGAVTGLGSLVTGKIADCERKEADDRVEPKGNHTY